MLAHHAALKRKGKGDDVTEEDMAAVVHAHNCKCPALGHQRVAAVLVMRSRKTDFILSCSDE